MSWLNKIIEHWLFRGVIIILIAELIITGCIALIRKTEFISVLIYILSYPFVTIWKFVSKPIKFIIIFFKVLPIAIRQERNKKRKKQFEEEYKKTEKFIKELKEKINK